MALAFIWLRISPTTKPPKKPRIDEPVIVIPAGVRKPDTTAPNKPLTEEIALEPDKASVHSDAVQFRNS